jgi:site-specific DNA-methyltransferase (adenine-specific)
LADSKKISQIEQNRIYNVDCITGMKKLKEKSVDLILTDIPYTVVNRKSNGLRVLNKKYADIGNFDLKKFLRECVRIVKGSIYIFCSTEQVSLVREFLVNAGMSTRLIIWEKTNPSPMNGEYIWLSGIELCVYGKFKGAVFNEKCKNSVFRFPNGRSKFHPTEKPVNLFKYLVEVSSNVGDLVLDPCIGSGTTAVACLEKSRNFIGFELNKKYYTYCKNRIHEWRSKHSIRELSKMKG